MSDAITYRSGTYRAAGPEETWERVVPMLSRFGITRVADITGLDDIGLPVHVAYRPTGLTYTVSIGSGGTVSQSRVGAVMESIETWHAENLRLPVAARGPAAALDLGYELRTLNLAPRSPLTPAVVLDWVPGNGLLTGREILAPAGCVRLDLIAPNDWALVLFQPTSNGLAIGNTAAEAILHGLLEVIERDSTALSLQTPAAQGHYVDPESCANPLTSRVWESLRAAGCTVTVRDITGPTGVPCYAAVIWSADVPIRCGGYGCHVDRGIAIGRAMAEAVQSRLAMISGARDDISVSAYRESSPPVAPAELAGVPDNAGWTDEGDLESVIRHCASLVAAVTGAEPFAVRLDHEDLGIPAVKVIAPGLRLMVDEPRGAVPPVAVPARKHPGPARDGQPL